MIDAKSDHATCCKDTQENKTCRFERKLLACLAIAAVLAASLGAVETLSQRRRRVEEMSAEQRDELFSSEKEFRALSPQDQQRIRDLHDQIESAPDRDKLRATMNRYCKWFETQPPFRRAKLLDRKRSTKDRIATVKEFLSKPIAPGYDIHLDDKNRRVLAGWLKRYSAEHEARFMDGLAQGSHPGIAKLPPDRQPAAMRENLLRRWQMGGPNGQPPISENEKARLLAGLSPELRSKLEARKPGEQAQILAEWLREAASYELDEQLVDYFENSISDEERDRLMSLPSDKDMYKSLSEQYSAHLKRSKLAEPPRGGPPSKQRGWRPGGPPWGSGAWRWPENRDEKEPRGENDSKDTQGLAAPASKVGKPPAESKTSEKPAAKNLGTEGGMKEH